MLLAVCGASGRLGRRVVAAVSDAGHRSVPLSRRDGVDVIAGTGLDEALRDADALIDVFDPGLRRRAPASSAFRIAERNLQAAALRAGVGRHVLVSIVGVDRPGLARMGYYRAKLVQEETVRSGVLPYAILRTTQWFSFADQVLQMARIGPVNLVPRMLSQPVDPDAVARRLVELAVADSAAAESSLAGPEPMSVRTLVERTLRQRGLRRRLVTIPMPGAAVAAARGDLLPDEDATLDATTLQDWLGPVKSA